MTIHFPGPVGRLEALLETPEEDGTGPPRAAAVVCHPHPLHGGSMQNSIVFRVARALRAAGLVTLRLNFRGVEGSEGVHDGTGAEEGDVAAALDELELRFPGLPLWAAGYSFGSRTVCGLATRDERIERVLGIAFPVQVYDASVLARLRQPTLLVMGDRDEFGTAEDLDRLELALPDHVRIQEIAGADHFFRGRTPLVEEAVRTFATQIFEDPS